MRKQTQVPIHTVFLPNALAKQQFSIACLLYSFPLSGWFHKPLNYIFDVHDNHSQLFVHYNTEIPPNACLFSVVTYSMRLTDT